MVGQLSSRLAFKQKTANFKVMNGKMRVKKRGRKLFIFLEKQISSDILISFQTTPIDNTVLLHFDNI